MILIAPIFLIAIVLMGASFNAMIKERRKYDRVNKSNTLGTTANFASL